MSSTITFAGKQCVEPRSLYRQCLDQGLPVDNWWGRANRFLCPRGRDWGTGTVLLTRESLDAITDINAEQKLVFDDGTAGGRVELQKITLAEPPRCLTPGIRGDKPAVYVVNLVDRRKALSERPIDRGYNIRTPDGTDYQPETLADGYCYGQYGADDDLWSWQCLVDDIVTGKLGLPRILLPYTPALHPENFAFYAMSAWDALTIVLQQLACEVTYDPVKDVFAIVSVGDVDAAADAALAAIEKDRIWDNDPKPSVVHRIPETLRFFFRKYPAPDDGSSPVQSVDQATGIAGAQPGSVLWLADCFGATLAGDTVTNLADLNTRAAERGSKVKQALQTGTDPLTRRYTGVKSADGLRPGRRVQGLAWLDVGNGMVTEVFRGPPPELALPPVTAATSVAGSSGGIIRTLAGVQGGFHSADDPATALPNGAYAYLALVQDWSLVGIFAPPDGNQACWLVPYYQEPVWGSLPDVTLDAGRAYPGFFTGAFATAPINLKDGGGNYLGCGGADPMVDNCVLLTLPVFWITTYPIGGTCTNDGPVFAGTGTE